MSDNENLNMGRLMSAWDQAEGDNDYGHNCGDNCHDSSDCDNYCDDNKCSNDKEQCDRLNFIIRLLESEKFGLKEIKSEVRTIESTVLNPTFGLAEIKKEIKGLEKSVEGIETTLVNPAFGLPEIKKEIRTIESTVLNPTFGLAEIKKEIKGLECAVAGIETTLLSPSFGLPEIKKEIRTIESTVLSPTFGLAEIKKEIKGLECAVAGIETTLLNPAFGLPEIKKEIRTIESTVLSPIFGLAEIKKEVKEILASITCNSHVRTTGPVIAECGSDNLIGKVLNNTLETRTVVVTAFNLESCPKKLDSIATLVIPPKSARQFDFRKVPEEYEVQVSGAVPGILIFSSTRSCEGYLNSSNTFRDSEFVCSNDHNSSICEE